MEVAAEHEMYLTYGAHLYFFYSLEHFQCPPHLPKMKNVFLFNILQLGN